MLLEVRPSAEITEGDEFSASARDSFGSHFDLVEVSIQGVQAKRPSRHRRFRSTDGTLLVLMSQWFDAKIASANIVGVLVIYHGEKRTSPRLVRVVHDLKN